MASKALFDLETDGLYFQATTIHCLVLYDFTTKKYHQYGNDAIKEGLEHLFSFTTLVGHNIIGFDLPIIRKLYPTYYKETQLLDTLVLSRLAYYDLYDHDVDIKPSLRGQHGLKAWGARLSFMKGEFAEETDWKHYSPEMLNYCKNDVELNLKVLTQLESKNNRKISAATLKVDQDYAEVIAQQVINGWYFDVKKAQKLHVNLLQQKEVLEDELQKVFKPRLLKKGNVRTYKNEPYRRGGIDYYLHSPVALTYFNPASRSHIALWLDHLYGWIPVQHTDKGSPIVDASVLRGLPYPEATILANFFDLQKVVGMLSKGDNAWLKKVDDDDYIHGEVNTLGTITGRCTHSKPNIAQTPKCGAFYGTECRELFTVPKGRVLIGCDASGLELRMLAHYMYKWDGGEYEKVILDGDIHTFNMKAAGLTDRNQAKTFIYAFLYGAGSGKIGSIVGGSSKAGKKLQESFLAGLPALKELKAAVEKKSKNGYLIGLTGRKISIRSPHSALNSLLQSAGAYVIKVYTIILMDKLKGYDAKLVGSIHDEVQLDVKREDGEAVAKICESIWDEVATQLKLNIKLEGEAKMGDTWAATH